MSGKANSFAEAMRAPPSAPPRAQETDTQEQGRSGPKSRPQKAHVGSYFSKETHQQLRMISAEEGVKMQDLLGEALDMLFASRGKPTIARQPME